MRSHPFRSFRVSISVGLLLSLVFYTTVGVAQEAAEPGPQVDATLPVMIVTATRDARRLNEAPYASNVLTVEQLRMEKAARTVPEALKQEPGTMIQKTSHGQGSPYIRGFTGQRTLFMIDGVRLNNSTFREGPNQYWNTVDPYVLDRMELVRGPHSVLYGSDAIGGTVNAMTRGVQNLRPDSRWDRRVFYRLSSAERSHIGRVESIGKVNDQVILTMGYTGKDFGELEGGKDVGTQAKTGYDENDWDAKLEYYVTDDGWIVLAHQTVDIDDAWRTHQTIYGIDWENLTVGDEYRRVFDQNRNLTYLQFHKVDQPGFIEELHAGVSHQMQMEERERLRTEDRRDVQGVRVHTFGSSLTLKSPSPIGTLLYGAEQYHDEVSSYNRSLNPDGSIGSASIQGPVADDASYDTLGVFLQDEIPLGERFALILGARHEYAHADADSVEDPMTGEETSLTDSWNEVVGSARLLYHLNPERTWTLFTGVSQGFRAPNLSDLTRFDTARTSEIETPSPDLDPERFVAYETGVKAATDRLNAQLAYFYTDISDMIVRTPTGRMIDETYEVTKKNGGDGYIHGLELDARYRVWGEWSVLGALTWMEGEIETYPTSDPEVVEEYIDRMMPPTGMIGIRWDHAGRFWVQATTTLAEDADKASTRDKADTSRIPPGGTPGFVVYDLRAGWNVGEDLQLSAALENLTDEDYRIHGSGVNEPGRNLVLTLDWVF
jgi:hemoglobin/transferrin/lactoferrin receptor protein